MESPIITLIIARDALLEAKEPVELRAGLNVVYGLNGAGKSRLLDAIENAIRGVEGVTNVALVIRIRGTGDRLSDDATSAQIRAYGRTPAQAIASSLASPEDFPWEIREFATPIHERTPRPDVVRELIDGWTRSRVGNDSELAHEILGDGLFLFAPTGTHSVPSWNVWPVADMRRTKARAAIQNIDLLYDLAHSDEKSYPEPVIELEEATTNSPLFATMANEVWANASQRRLLEPTPLMPYAIGEHDADQVEPVHVAGRIDFGLELIDSSREPNDATVAHFGVLHSFLLRRLLSENDETLSLATFRDAGLHLLSPEIWPSLTADQEPKIDWGEALLRAHRGDADESIAEPDISAVEQAMGEVAVDLEGRVNTILQSVLLDAPKASLRVASPLLRFVQRPIVWTFGKRRLRLRDLSRAEKLWASRAIHEAIHEQTRDLALDSSMKRTVLSIVDEPEAALHRAAESHMASTLRRRSRDAIVVAATHSPELLDAPEGRIIEVKRNADKYGRSRIQELDQRDRTNLTDLGLLPSDLLRWSRVILLVEGEHDEALLDEFLGDRLRSAHVRILPLHGGSKLPGTVDSQVLFEHTDAHVVALLDNTRSKRLREVWARAVELALLGETASAKSVVIDGLPDDRKRKGDEAGYMRSWLTKAIDAGLAARATPYGLEKVDIIRYLPVQKIVPGATSWDDLDAQHQDEIEKAHPTKRPPADFKKWLSTRWKVEVSPRVLREAASGGQTPQDFLRLMKMLEAIASDVR